LTKKSQIFGYAKEFKPHITKLISWPYNLE
jgi:hypothetical protein